MSQYEQVLAALKRTEDRVRSLERELAEVRRQTGKLPTRLTAGGGGGGGILVVATYADLPSEGPPQEKKDSTLAYLRTPDYFYGMRNGHWRILHAFKQDATPANVGEQDGDTWYKPTGNCWYLRWNGSWILLPILRVNGHLLQYWDPIDAGWFTTSHY
jgi:hypothetical protein